MGAVGSGSWVPGVDEVGTVSVDRDAKSSAESPGPWLLCCHSRPPPPPPTHPNISFVEITDKAISYCSGFSVGSPGLPVVIVSLASCLHFIRLF